MNNKNKVEITLLVSNRSGILSALMIKGGSLGLMYRGQQAEKINADTSRITISFDGKLNCNKQQSIQFFAECQDVIKVEKIEVSNPDQTT